MNHGKHTLLAVLVLVAALLILVAVIAVTSCTPPDERVGSELTCKYIANCSGYRIRRFIDHEAQVVCWTRNGGGLSCLPLEETALATIILPAVTIYTPWGEMPLEGAGWVEINPLTEEDALEGWIRIK